MVIGALEAGGTKMVCAVGDQYGNIAKRTVFPTQKPDLTMPKMIDFFKQEAVQALGIGCFGPLNLDKNHAQFGTITSTPKAEWRQYPIAGAFQKELQIPVILDTDVNAAALGEATWGAGIGDDVVLYITIGTGVGAGLCIGGKLLHGLVHPEAGHILLARRADDSFQGTCPYHRDCLEGLASGPAIKGRWGQSAEKLAGKNQVWEMEADYIAQALTNYILVYSPNRIILGGGVMHQLSLFPMIREKVKEYLNGYVVHPLLQKEIDQYIVSPKLGDNAGIKGALQLAIALVNE